MTAAADRLKAALARNQALAARLETGGAPLQALEAVQAWQRARLARTHASLLRQDDAADAGRFFLSQLYGGLDFIERDRAVARVAPLMGRMLPDSALTTLAEAFELQALSLELDLALTAGVDAPEALDPERYAAAYRATDTPEARERQLALIKKLGTDLDRLVRKPMLLRLIRLMRGPAHAAGYGRLHDFLEEGLGAFQRLDDPVAFVGAIHDTEVEVRRRLLAGADDPLLLDDAAAESL